MPAFHVAFIHQYATDITTTTMCIIITVLFIHEIKNTKWNVVYHKWYGAGQLKQNRKKENYKTVPYRAGQILMDGLNKQPRDSPTSAPNNSTYIKRLT